MIEEIRWVHLSDLHLRASGDLYSQRTVTEDLIRDLRHRLVDFGELHFALISGDLAFSGQAAEYELARVFVDGLAEVTGLSPAAMFFVPGNHDVDWSRAEYQYHGVRGEATSQTEVDRFLGHPDEVARLLQRQEAFWRFDASLHNAEYRKQTDDRLGYCATLNIGGFVVAVAALNTAWLSGPNDEQSRLVIGERHYMQVLELAEESHPQLLLGLGHHPLEWLREWDRASCEVGLLGRVDVYHRGHEHRAVVGLGAQPSSPCLMVVAGASHASRQYANSYNLMRLRIGDGECDVSSMSYLPPSNSFEGVGETAAPISLRRSLSAHPADLANALSVAIPRAESHRNYVVALLSGQVTEVPVTTDGGPLFAAPGVASEVGAIAPETVALGRLVRLLPAYQEAVSLEDRLREHEDTVLGFVDHLDALAAEDTEFAQACALREAQCARLLSVRPLGERPNAKALLADLMSSGDSGSIISLARRYHRNDDPELSLTATRALISCLIRSQEATDLEEALLLAERVMGRADAIWHDWILGVGAAEAGGHDERATEWAAEALRRWAGDEGLRCEIRAFARRTNNRGLLDRLQSLDGGEA